MKKIRKIILAKKSYSFFRRIPSKFISSNLLWKFHQKLLNKSLNQNKNFIGYGFDTTISSEPFSINNFFPLKTVEFEGKFFPAPNNTDYYLNLKYGDYMKLPPEKDRVCQHGNIIKIG